MFGYLGVTFVQSGMRRPMWRRVQAPADDRPLAERVEVE